MDNAKRIVKERELSESGKETSKMTKDERIFMSKNKDNKKLSYHFIHGKYYDLNDFFNSGKHPGGNDIIISTKGLIDSTPLFESYHSMANRDYIINQLEKYRVFDDGVIENCKKENKNTDNGIFSFNDDGFYRAVTKRVRKYFVEQAGKENDDGKSLTNFTKADKWWILKVSIQFFISILLFSFAFLYPKLSNIVISDNDKLIQDNTTRNQTSLQSEERFNDMIYAFISGCFFIQWGFTVMHDGSHFAIAPKNHWINQFLTKIWCSFLLWSSKIWFLHHCILHHSFTGNSLLDPDERHAMPFIRKHPDTPRHAQSPIFGKVGEYIGFFGYATAASILYFFLPGMWLGQVLQYLAFTLTISNWKYLWGMIYPSNDVYPIKWYEYFLPCLQILSHIYRGDALVSFSFIIALNFFYAISIVGDHDTVDAAIINHVDFSLNPENNNQEIKVHSEIDNYSWGKLDWGEMQVRNSSNFINHRYYDIFSMCFGSINYQIEHHLFPGISHIHLPKIAPIVKQTCKEFKIPYVSHPNLFSVAYSFLNTIHALASPQLGTKESKTIHMKKL